MATNTEKRRTPNTLRRAEDIDRFRESLALGEALRAREERIADRQRNSTDDTRTFIGPPSAAEARQKHFAAALLDNPTVNLQTLPPPAEGAALANEERSAIRKALEVWSDEHAKVSREVGATLWNEDYEEIDLQNRKEEFALIVALGKAELKRREWLARAGKNGALPGRVSDMPFINFSQCAPMARAIQVLANYVSAFEGCNKNLKS
jgi:hypothetical protein